MTLDYGICLLSRSIDIVFPIMIKHDIWNDPYCLRSLHEERSDLVKKYAKFLEEKWKEHLSLANNFSRT